MGNDAVMLASDGQARQEAQIVASRFAMAERNAVGVVRKMAPRISLWGLLFCFGWIGCEANYQVKHLAEQARAERDAKLDVVRKLTATSRELKAEHEELEYALSPAPGILPTPKPQL